MNHLWIQFFPDDTTIAKNAEMHIQLPDGIYRSHNLNGYVENESKCIFIDLSKDKDVLIEIFTNDAIPCGKATIIVTLNIGQNEHIKEVPIHLASDEEMDAIEINEQVIERLKELCNPAENLTHKELEFFFYQSRVIEPRNNKLSYLEKKYRVDYFENGGR